MKFARFTALPLLCSAIAWSPTALTHTFEFDLLTGSDSNPNELQSSYEVDGGIYGQVRLELSHIPSDTGVYYHLEGTTSVYLEDEDAASDPQLAEESTANAKLGFFWRPRKKHGYAEFEFELIHESKDAIFVDPTTGDTARFVDILLAIDEPVGDRFDYSASGFRTTGNTPISEQANWVYDLQALDVSYESYIALEPNGLSNLDNQQIELDTGFEKWIWPRAKLTTLIGIGLHQYTDRRGLTYDRTNIADGTVIANSNLDFTFLEVRNSIDVHFTDRFHWLFGFAAQQRKDSEDGYYDSTEGEVFTLVQYRNQDFVDLWLSASYTKGKYDNITQMPSILEDDIWEREGIIVKAELVRNMYQWTRIPFDVIIGAQVTDYTHDNPNFTYDQTMVYAGVRWRPFDLLKD